MYLHGRGRIITLHGFTEQQLLGQVAVRLRPAEMAAVWPTPTVLREGGGCVSGDRSRKRAALWLRRTARGLGTLVAGFWVLIGVLEAIAGTDPWTVESAVLATLIVAAALAVAAAWWREGIGGILLILVGAAHCVFAFIAAGHNKLFAVAITGVPFLLVGTLFLTSWSLSRRMEAAQS